MRNPLRPAPAPPGFGIGRIVPVAQASWLSQLTFYWLDPILKVGFSRPLQKDDFWELQPERLTANLSEAVERNFYARCPPEQRPAALLPLPEEDLAFAQSLTAQATEPLSVKCTDGQNKNSPDKVVKEENAESEDGTAQEIPQQQEITGDPSKKYDGSLLGALHTTFFWQWWIAGILYLGAVALQTTSPLLNRILLNWLVDSYAWYRIPEQDRSDAAEAYGITQPRGVGHGIGLAFALF